MTDSLTVNWPYFLGALAMLWFPRQWMRTGTRVLKRRRKPDGALEKLAGVGARDPEDKSVHPGKEFATFRNYIDLFRSAAGGYSLAQFSFADTTEETAVIVLLIQATALLVGVAIQAVRIENGRISFFAPLFYYLGFSTGFPAHYAGLFSFALVLAINPVIPNPRWFITAFALLLTAFAVLFGADLRMTGVMVLSFLLVPLASLLTKRPVVIFSRKSRASKPSS